MQIEFKNQFRDRWGILPLILCACWTLHMICSRIEFAFVGQFYIEICIMFKVYFNPALTATSYVDLIGGVKLVLLLSTVLAHGEAEMLKC